MQVASQDDPQQAKVEIALILEAVEREAFGSTVQHKPTRIDQDEASDVCVGSLRRRRIGSAGS